MNPYPYESSELCLKKLYENCDYSDINYQVGEYTKDNYQYESQVG
jgi:hypothetical protein